MNAEISRITPELRAALLQMLAEEQDALPARTLNELWGPYLAYKQTRLRPRSIAAMASRMKPLLAMFGDRPAAGLKYEDADAFCSWMMARPCAMRAHTVTRSHASQCLQGLLAVLNWAVRRRFLKENPLSGYEATAPTSKRERVFTQEEIGAVLKASKHAKRCKEIFVVVSVMKDSGVRPIELLSLNVEHVDLQKGLLTIPASIAKTKVQRQVPILPDGVAALRGFIKRRKPGQRLFDCCYSSLSAQWRKCCEAAAIAPNKDGSPAQLYSTRHTLATRLATELGFQPFELAQWMGWSNVQQAQTYVKTTETALLSSARKVDAANLARPPVKKRATKTTVTEGRV